MLRQFARAAVVAFVLTVALTASADEPALWAGLHAGRYPVGYLHLSASDAAVDLWYPAAAPGRSLTLQSYLGPQAGAVKSFLAERGLPAESVAAYVEAPMFATWEAVPLPRRFAVVAIAQGNEEDAADQAVLAEYISSHGFVVVSVPSPMLRERMTDAAQIPKFAEAQADALEQAIAVARRILGIRPDRIAVVGHSFGARAALLLAMRQPSVRALVSLDGGIGTATGIEELRSAPSFKANAQLPPLLHAYEELDPFMKPDFTFLRTLHLRKLELVKTRGMHHVHFTTYGFAAAAIPSFASTTKAGPEIREEVRRTAETVLQFLVSKLE